MLTDTTQTNTGTTVDTTTTATPEFTKVLQDKLLSTSEMISSANTGIESAIQSAIGGVKESTTKGTQAIASQYDRQIGYTKETLGNQITAAQERGVGVNTSDVAYKAMASEADKQLKDLDMRKNELMLQNDAAGASKIADLQLETLKMKNQAMQQTFQNLLSTAGFGLQVQSENRQAQAQNFAEKSAIAKVGLEYGIPVKEGDTIESIVTRAAPTASKIQQANLAKILAETNRANAEAAKAAREGKVVGNLNDPATREAYIGMALNQPELFNTLLVKDPTLVSIRNEALKKQTSYINKSVADLASKGLSYTAVKDAIVSDKTLGSNLDPHAADKAILEAYDAYKVPLSEVERKKKEETAKVGAFYTSTGSY